MKKRSKLWILFHHPIRVILYSALMFFAIGVILSEFTSIPLYKIKTVLVIVSVFLGLCTTQSMHNKNLEKSEGTQRKRRGLLGLVFASASAVDRSMSRQQRAMEDAILSGLTGSSSPSEEARRQAARRQADANARARWDAIDRQKKAEYDARDAALRGKDKAAYQYQNQADYWYNESKRY